MGFYFTFSSFQKLEADFSELVKLTPLAQR